MNINTLSKLDILDISDFQNHNLLQLYLKDHGVKIINDGKCYTMTWKYGFMGMICPENWHIRYAEIWSFYFVWYWLRGKHIEKAEEKASKMMMKQRKKDKEYARKMYEKRHKERTMK